MAYFVGTKSVKQNLENSLRVELAGEELRRRVRLFRSGHHPDRLDVLDAEERGACETEELERYLTLVVALFLRQCGQAYRGKSPANLGVQATLWTLLTLTTLCSVPRMAA
jgi:hypothetical protein